jgi:hypothetical protein
VTFKAFPNIHISLANMAFGTTDNSDDVFWQAQEIYHRSTPAFTDVGAWVLGYHTPNAFFVPAFILPNHTEAQTQEIVAPMLRSFDSLGLNYTFTLNQYSGYLEMIKALPPFENPPINDAQYGGRLLPRSIWEDEESFQKLVSVLKEITSQGVLIADVAMSPTLERGGNPDNSVFSHWRNAHRLAFTQMYFFTMHSTPHSYTLSAPLDLLQRGNNFWTTRKS